MCCTNICFKYRNIETSIMKSIDSFKELIKITYYIDNPHRIPLSIFSSLLYQK